MDVDMWLVYRAFVIERHKIWERRQAGEPGPWTLDPILASRKFTNVFRVLDPGTQFVLTDLAGGDPRDELFRLFLYRHTGRVEAWQYLPLFLGDYPGADDSDAIVRAWEEYRGPGVWKPSNRKVFTGGKRRAGGHGSIAYARSVFTGAYLVFPQSQERGTDKMKSIISLAERVFERDNRVIERWLEAKVPQERFRILQHEKGVGDFMAMQILTDWNYLHAGDEDTFVVPGPGAKKGAAALAPGDDPTRVVFEARENLLQDVECPTLEGCPPSLMDVQNTLCEFSKYVRYLGRDPGRAYEPAHPGNQEPPVLPQHWATKGISK